MRLAEEARTEEAPRLTEEPLADEGCAADMFCMPGDGQTGSAVEETIPAMETKMVDGEEGVSSRLYDRAGVRARGLERLEELNSQHGEVIVSRTLVEIEAAMLNDTEDVAIVAEVAHVA